MKSVREQIELIRQSLALLEATLTEDELEFIADNAPIRDMLKWRGMPGDNFYNTVQHYLKTRLIGIGQYDMPNGVILALTDEIGLQILGDYNRYTGGDKVGHPVDDEDWRVGLDFQFVPLPDDTWLSDPVSVPDAWVASGSEFADAVLDDQ